MDDGDAGRTDTAATRLLAEPAAGKHGPTDQQTVTVYVPEGNMLNVEALRKLMEQSRRGEI